MRMAARVLLFICVIVGVQSYNTESNTGYADPNIIQCRKDDTACMVRNVNGIYHRTVQGVPEWKIENMDPMFQSETEGNLVLIKYKLQNTTLFGFDKCNLNDLRLNLKESKLRFNMLCPYFDISGLYQASGTLIIVPIEGDGYFRVHCKDYEIKVDTNIKVIKGKDGKKYFQIKSFKVDADLQGELNTNLTNLFHGQREELAKALLQFINNNPKPVSKEIQGPIFTANLKSLLKNLNRYLKRVPLEQLFQ